MNIYNNVHTPFAKACEDRLLSSIGKNVSKHRARAEAVQNGSKRQSSGLLHADTTIDNYAKIAQKYAVWMKENHPDCRRLLIAHKRHYDREFVQSIIDAGRKPATIKTYTAAVAFLHNCTMREVHSERPVVCAQDATRCRTFSEDEYNRQLARRTSKGQSALADIMQICRMAGLRKDEAQQIRRENFLHTQDGWVCHVTGSNKSHRLRQDESVVHTKGGRERTIEIVPRYENILQEILARAEPGKPICSQIPDRVNIHGIRALYAAELYLLYARQIEQIPPNERTRENGKDRPSRYVDHQGKVWDRRALLRVSASLGHNRSEVVVQNYLWVLR